MEEKGISEIKRRALQLLRSSVTEGGILASASDKDNYNRIWARDSVISGISGLLHDDSILINALKESLDTLANNQHDAGFIPSNVSLRQKKVSYGSLSGRVDASLWFLAGVAIYTRYTGDVDFLHKHRNSILKIIRLSQAWEYNGRHLIYTPLSGNWADEYPLHGYLLYDNALRLWGMKLITEYSIESGWKEKIEAIERMFLANLVPVNASQKEEDIYHPLLHSKIKLDESVAGFHPGGYYSCWDTAGQALELLAINPTQMRRVQLQRKSEELTAEVGAKLFPAFWPVIHINHPLWPDLTSNYSYSFKNKPHHFHNGGIWPVMMGLFLMASEARIEAFDVSDYKKAMLNLIEQDNYQFSEYFNSLDFKPGGQQQLCFSAAGVLFILADNDKVKRLILPSLSV
jgi:hypothetical protein